MKLLTIILLIFSISSKGSAKTLEEKMKKLEHKVFKSNKHKGENVESHLVYTVSKLVDDEELLNDVSTKKIESIQRNKIDKVVKSINESESYSLPVVDYHSIKMNMGINSVRKCISKESEGTAEDYINEGELRVTSYGSGLFKNIEILKSETMPLYLKACFMSGFSRIIYAQPMDGDESTIRQKFAIGLRPEDLNPSNRLKLNLLGKISLELSMKSKLLLNQ